MKFNFRKISAIASSVLLAGMTLGVAAAANYPAPFVSGGTADVAIVYGTGAGVSALDQTQAYNINLNLQSTSTGATSAAVSGGDSVHFTKSATKFHIGMGILDVRATSIGDDDMANLLKDGLYVDDDNDEFDYTQKIEMANSSLTMFEDNEYKEDEPVIGVIISNNAKILNYTLDMVDTPTWADLPSSYLPLMGKQYYVLSETNGSIINLLDAAVSATLNEGETTTVVVDGTTYEVGVNFIGSSTVKLDVNGVVTNSLAALETQKLAGGAYLGIKEISTQDYSGGIKTVDFSIGKGKLKLTDAQDIELNDEVVTDVKAYLSTSALDTLDGIVIDWTAADDLFVAGTDEVVMPGLETLKLSFGGMVYPVEEKISISAQSETTLQFNNFPLKTSTESINFLYGDGTTYNGIGKDANNRLATTNETELLFFNDTLDDYFIASWSDGNDAESYLMRATNFKVKNNLNATTFQYKKDGAWTSAKDDAIEGDVVTIGNAEITVGAIDSDGVGVNMSAGSSVEFDTLYSKEGLKIFLPFANTSGAIEEVGMLNATADATFALVISEEDLNDNIGDGANITVTLGFNSASTPEVSVTGVSGGGGTSTEILETDVWRNLVYSALATEILWKKPTGGQNSLDLIYHGGESWGDVFLAAPSATVSQSSAGTGGSASVGNVVVKDSEVSSVSTKNLIVVGGSCINSAAAAVLGGAYCGADFTTATGIGSGQFLIKGVSGAYSTGKIALVVAGYDAADTVAASTYLTTQTVDTSKAYKGTSSTSATVIVE